jgi:hypothetical protein
MAKKRILSQPLLPLATPQILALHLLRSIDLPASWKFVCCCVSVLIAPICHSSIDCLALGVLSIRDIDEKVHAANDLSLSVAHNDWVWRKPEACAVRPFGYALDTGAYFPALNGYGHWALFVRQRRAVRLEELPCYAPTICAKFGNST